MNINTPSDILIILKNGNQTIHVNAHRDVLITNDYFKKLFTSSFKEKDANQIILEVSNIYICKDIIMSFYGTPVKYSSYWYVWEYVKTFLTTGKFNSIKCSGYRYILEYVKCCNYWMVPCENVLTDDLKVPEEGFDLLLELAELMNYSDPVLKIIARNIPMGYDLNGIPRELKDRMISLEQIDCIASVCFDNTIKIWNFNTGKESREYQPSGPAEIKTFNGHAYPGSSVCYIPEKNQIAFGCYDKTIKIWDLNTGVEVGSLKGHTGWLYDVCYITGKNQIASGSFDKTIKIWDLDSGKESEGFQPMLGQSPTGAVVKTLNGHTNSVLSICYIHEKNQIASGSIDNTIKIWDLDKGKEYKGLQPGLFKSLTGHTGSITSIFYIQDKNQIASGSIDNTIKIWDLDTGAIVKTLIGHATWVTSVCYIPGKNQIASGYFDGIIKIWDLDSGKEFEGFQPRLGESPNSIVIRTLIGHTSRVTSLCYIPDKNQIASGSYDETIKIWDLDSGAIIKSLNLHYSINYICYVKMDSDLAKRLKN